MSKTEEISDEELKALMNAIKKRYDIDFTNYETKSLKRGVGRLISKHKLGSLLGLWSKVLKDHDFFMQCVDDLTVNLTELFRNPDFWTHLQNEVVKKYKASSSLDIWHAGCSTGEEVYTMSIMLDDHNMLNKSSLLATDLSSRALAKAMKGSYSTVLFEKYKQSYSAYNPQGKFEHYFDHDGKTLTIKPKLKSKISFRTHNLVHDPMHQKFDIIFCRNVMIYFDEVLKMKVLQLFYESLKDKGLFVIGYYDMLPDMGKELFGVVDAQTRIYHKM